MSNITILLLLLSRPNAVTDRERFELGADEDFVSEDANGGQSRSSAAVICIISSLTPTLAGRTKGMPDGGLP